ncbi:hypothetical protein ACN47E_004368 [Coniothyrium glycines]
MSGAELGLAIAGVAATGAALSKVLFDICHTVRHAPRDVKDIATYLRLLRSVLRELQHVLQKSGNVCSPEADEAIRGLLSECSEIFDAIEKLTASMRPADGSALTKTPFKEKVKWHFRKEELSLLKSRLEALKTTIHLMVSIIQIRRQFSPPASRGNSCERSKRKLTSALLVASELVEGERNCLADLLLIEEQFESNRDPTQEVKITRISAWLSDVVGLGESGSSRSVTSGRSNWTLSAAQRSITGSAADDVEMLLERWTTPSAAPSTPSEANSARGPGIALGAADPASSTGLQTADRGLDEREAGSALNHTHDALSRYNHGAHSINSDDDTSIESISTSSLHDDLPNSSTLSGSSSSASSSSRSNSAGSNTPTERSVASRENRAHGSHIRGKSLLRNNLAPILMNNGGDGDDETVRDLRRASRSDRKVRISLPLGSMDAAQSKSSIEQWIKSSAADDSTASSHIADKRESRASPYAHHLPFSQISLSSSKSPSEMGSIATIGDTDAERHIGRLIRAGNGLIRLKRYAEAASLFREAYDVKKKANETTDKQMFEIRFKIGILLGELGKYPSAERLLEQLVQTQTQTSEKEVRAAQRTKHYLGHVYSKQEKWSEASDIFQQLWVARKDCLDQDKCLASQIDLTLRTGCEYGYVLLETGAFQEAQEVFSVVYNYSRISRGHSDVRFTLTAGIQAGRASRCLSQYEEALKILSSVRIICEEGPISDEACRSLCLHEMSMVYHAQGDYDACEPLARELWYAKARSSRLGSDIKDLELAECYATCLRASRQNSEAHEVYKFLHGGLVERHGEHHPRAIKITQQLTDILLELEEEEEMESRLQTALVACRPITSENVTEDVLNIAEKLGPRLLEKQELFAAADVYDTIFIGEKKFLGLDCPLTLSNGHEYGSLCLTLRRLPLAEDVLTEVWDHSRQILGDADQRSMATGFQLGQVYFLSQNIDAAIATHRCVLDQRLQRFGQTSVEAIESSEVLGLALVSNEDMFADGFKLLRQALESRKQIYGSEMGTLSSAFRLATLSASRGRFADASELFRWIFDNSRDSKTTKVVTGAYASGLAAAGTAFLQRNRREGNDMIARVIALMGKNEGQNSSAVKTIAYGRAMLLFLQREGSQCRAVLRGQFNLQKRLYGSQHNSTLIAGEVFAIGSLLDSLLTKSHIDDEIDNITDWLFTKKDGRTTIVMRFAMAACAVFAMTSLDDLAQALLKWLYRTQKRLLGRFHQATLITLAIHHSLHLRSLYKSARKIPTLDHTSRDPRVMLKKFWPNFTRTASNALMNTNVSAIDMRPNVLATWLPKIMSEWTLFKGYRRERLNHFFMPPEEFFVYPQFAQSPFADHNFADHVRSKSRSQPPDEDAASRIWTVTSEELLDSDAFKHNDKLETDSIDFSDITHERMEGGLQSLGESLIDLVMTSDAEDDTDVGAREEIIEARLDDLHRDLVNEVVDEASINTARENYQAFEAETDAS